LSGKSIFSGCSGEGLESELDIGFYFEIFIVLFMLISKAKLRVFFWGFEKVLSFQYLELK